MCFCTFLIYQDGMFTMEYGFVKSLKEIEAHSKILVRCHFEVIDLSLRLFNKVEVFNCVLVSLHCCLIVFGFILFISNGLMLQAFFIELIVRSLKNLWFLGLTISNLKKFHPEYDLCLSWDLWRPPLIPKCILRDQEEIALFSKPHCKQSHIPALDDIAHSDDYLHTVFCGWDIRVLGMIFPIVNDLSILEPCFIGDDHLLSRQRHCVFSLGLSMSNDLLYDAPII